MKLSVKNSNTSLRFCLVILKVFGFLIPEVVERTRRTFSKIYCFFWFMVIVGNIFIAQVGAVFEIWGDIDLMTSAAFLLFTNLALSIKLINVIIHKREVLDIIDEADAELMGESREAGIEIVKSCNQETTKSLQLYILLAAVTVFGWAASAEKGQLPLRAWYPYDTSKSPAYEITYFNQSVPLIISALVNVCLDTLVTSTVAVCRCRLRLVALSLRTLCVDVDVENKDMSTEEREIIIYCRLIEVVKKHESVLNATRRIEMHFTRPILAQFTVSVVIVCVTAYQLALELQSRKWVRIISMVAYLLCMMLQVFFYCYQGHRLSGESSDITDAAYECPWYLCSLRIRRSLIIVMQRTRRASVLTAGGFATLSLSTFTSIIKASYTFFTVLKQVDDRNGK